ncbi:hypothetical protein K438DRAFT_1986204 [Mycena galopus ATCC 62051]|nr:hypothetical protein K438DRAFT_1986204 [Mycena galopus ATCC 62051]
MSLFSLLQTSWLVALSDPHALRVRRPLSIFLSPPKGLSFSLLGSSYETHFVYESPGDQGEYKVRFVDPFPFIPFLPLLFPTPLIVFSIGRSSDTQFDDQGFADSSLYYLSVALHPNDTTGRHTVLLCIDILHAVSHATTIVQDAASNNCILANRYGAAHSHCIRSRSHVYSYCFGIAGSIAAWLRRATDGRTIVYHVVCAAE